MSDEPEETSYYLRLMSMYMDLGTETALGVFTYHSPNKNPEAFIKSNEEKLIELKKRHILKKQELQLIFTDKTDGNNQRFKNTVNVSEFDISLLTTLSINLFNEQQLQPPAKGWKNPPLNGDKSIAADILRLRTKRNVIVGHHHKARMPRWRFEDEWKEISDILIRIHTKLPLGQQKNMKERIDAYRVQNLDSTDPHKHDTKINEWIEEVTKIQDSMEESCKKLKDFDAYFKGPCTRYQKYIVLLMKGGSFVLLSFIEMELQNCQSGLFSILNEHTSEEYVRHLGYTMSNYRNLCKNSNLSTWSISNMAMLIDIKFGNNIEEVIREAVRSIAVFYENYAKAAVDALDGSKFEELSSELKTNLRIVANYLNPEQKKGFREIMDECKDITVENFQIYEESLRAQSAKMKSFADILTETVKQTKECLQEMVAKGISFKKGRTLELKMITHGNDEQDKENAEYILEKVWQVGLEKSKPTALTKEDTEFDETYPHVVKEIKKVIDEVRRITGAQISSVEKACIILYVTCGTPDAMLQVICYFESREFQENIRTIATELGDFFNTTFAFNSLMQIDNLTGITKTTSTSVEPKKYGIRLPISVSSPAGMMQLKSSINRYPLTNSVAIISGALSRLLETNLTVELTTDLKELHDLVEDEVDAEKLQHTKDILDEEKLQHTKDILDEEKLQHTKDILDEEKLQHTKDILDEEKLQHTKDILDEEKLQHTKDILDEEKLQHTKDILDEEKLQHTKDILLFVADNGIDFKNDEEIDIKINTLGDDSEKIDNAETILKGIFEAALKNEKGSTNSEYSQVVEEVRTLLKGIQHGEHIKKVSVERACILLHVSCGTPDAMLKVIRYFESNAFREKLRIIANEFGKHFKTTLSFDAEMPVQKFRRMTDMSTENIEYVELRDFHRAIASIKKIRRFLERLQEYSRNIDDISIEREISKLIQETDTAYDDITRTLSETRSHVKYLSHESFLKNPSKILDKLENDISVCEAKMQNILKVIVNLRSNIKDKVKNQTQPMRQDIQQLENEASDLDRDADTLETRAHEIRQKEREASQSSFLWKIGCLVVGTLLAPFTGGASFGAGVLIAGLSDVIDFNQAIDCVNGAARMRSIAQEKRGLVQSKKIETERRVSKDCEELDTIVVPPMPNFERAIRIVKDFKHEAERKEEMRMKFKWIILQQMILYEE